METLLLWTLFNLVAVGDVKGDPVNQSWSGRDALRQFQCERISQAEAHRRFPTQVPQSAARMETFYTVDAMICERFMAEGVRRDPRDQAILESLTQDAAELTGLAQGAYPDASMWYVDAFYPNRQMTAKIANAGRTSLAESGARVSQKAPLLSAGDILVMHDYTMKEAIEIACSRYFDQGILKADQAFLALALLNGQETNLHAGVCTRGKFRWLR